MFNADMDINELLSFAGLAVRVVPSEPVQLP